MTIPSCRYFGRRLDLTGKTPTPCFAAQSGGECLRAYISQAPQQIAAFCDSDGKTGLWYSVQVAGHLLNPMGSEFTATFVGRLITTLMRKVGDQLGENLDLLLKSVLSKLRGSQTLTVIQASVEL